MPADANPSGKLVVLDKGNFSTISLPEGERYPLPEGLIPVSLSPVTISPDNKKIALLEEISFLSYSRLIVMDYGMKIIRSFEWEPNWMYARWLDNDRIYIAVKSPDFISGPTPNAGEILMGPNTTVIPSLGSIDILNIHTGERQTQIFPYSDEVYVEYGVAKVRTGFVAYNPTLESVMYEGWGNVFILRTSYGFPPGWWVTWARKNYANWAEPVWSFDGDKIAVPLSENMIEDLYIVGFIGGEKRLTDFAKMYPNGTQIYGIAWSPDSAYIALQLAVAGDDYSLPYMGRLLVVDVASRHVTDYCLSYDYPPVWSPDGRYIAVDNMIVDLANERAYTATENGYIIGWLADTP